MKIDGNELAIRQNDLDREGRHEEAMAIKKEFLKQVRESGDHRDHLPMCMWDMVNERLHKLSLMTEGTLRDYEDRLK